MMDYLGKAFLLTAVCILIGLGGIWPAGLPATAASCASAPRDDAAASDLLATQRPFQPTNIDRFNTYANPAWADQTGPVNPLGPARSEAETRAALRDFLTLRFPCNPQRVLDGMTAYNNPLAIQKLPDPTLRAALAALTGTIGEPAISFLLLEAPVSAIFFGVVMHYQEGIPPGNSGAVYSMPDGTIVMVIDSAYRFNAFPTLSALIFHEALHVEFPLAPANKPWSKPDGVGEPEETVAMALEALVYMQMLLTDPAIAQSQDLITRGVNNENALTRLDSGLAGTDQLNIFLPGNESNIDPVQATPITQFYDYYAATSYTGPTSEEAAWKTLETHGNELLAQVLPALAEPGATAPAAPDYDRATLDFIDQNQAVLSPGDLLAVACALELDVPCNGQKG